VLAWTLFVPGMPRPPMFPRLIEPSVPSDVFNDIAPVVWPKYGFRSIIPPPELLVLLTLEHCILAPVTHFILFSSFYLQYCIRFYFLEGIIEAYSKLSILFSIGLLAIDVFFITFS
jgi:hypothetical protein